MCLFLSFFGPSKPPKQGAVSSQLYHVRHGCRDNPQNEDRTEICLIRHQSKYVRATLPKYVLVSQTLHKMAFFVKEKIHDTTTEFDQLITMIERT